MDGGKGNVGGGKGKVGGPAPPPFPPPPPPPGPARQQNVNHDVVWGVMQKLVEKL